MGDKNTINNLQNQVGNIIYWIVLHTIFKRSKRICMKINKDNMGIKIYY